MVNRPDKILVVDDMATIRKLICHRLTKEGYRCEEAASAAQTLTSLEKSPAELVLLDIQMPGKSGLDILPEIKSGYPVTSVIMATAVDESDVVIECMKKGADDYVFKPLDLDNVVRSVRRALEKRQQQVKASEYKERLEREVEEQTREIRKLFLGAIESLVHALEAKDAYTAGHSRRVTEIAQAIGRELGLPPDDMEDLR